MNKKEELQKILSLRQKVSVHGWREVYCDTSKATFVEIVFKNSESDFRAQRYPHDLDEVLTDQRRKLVRDLVNFFGKENMDVLQDTLS